ncbi:carboxypeptidase-like regulatory domain-containing protein [Mesonia maritima]|uniref:Carboxypeptidase-like regulatory domain-containing protein n=1 Tax=Mesonia maritima TaxID=1793873 RepID=A0ABU1K3A9_9FLAO|nr:carboxypeptidase-like regulatory domain-containing protein [Mesonia maritima]MDR6300105.1 hypothetical protein [Mesonia maritima]
MKFLIVLLFPFVCVGQNFNSQIKASKNSEVLSYVNISILNKRVGTNTDANGEFTLNLKNFKKDTLLISYLGYTSIKIPVKNILAYPSEYKLIYLEEEKEKIDEIILSVKRKKYGFSHTIGARKNWFSSSVGVQFGMEQTIYFENPKEKKGKIEEVSFWVNKKDNLYSNSRLTWFRIKFYEYDSTKNEPGKLLSYEDILLKSVENKKQELKVKLKNYHIPFPTSGICVSIETVNPNPNQKNDSQFMTYPVLMYSREKENRSWHNYRDQGWYARTSQERVEGVWAWSKKLYYINPTIKIKYKYER